MQWSARINEAYARLKAPLARATLLCELAGAPIRAEDNTAMPADFLIEQLAWREALDAADSRPALRALGEQVEARLRLGRERLAESLDIAPDAAAAAREVRALMFVERFARDIADRLDAVPAS